MHEHLGIQTVIEVEPNEAAVSRTQIGGPGHFAQLQAKLNISTQFGQDSLAQTRQIAVVALGLFVARPVQLAANWAAIEGEAVVAGLEQGIAGHFFWCSAHK